MNNIQRFINRAIHTLTNVKGNKGNLRRRTNSTEESGTCRTGKRWLSCGLGRGCKEESEHRKALRTSKAFLQPLRKNTESKGKEQVAFTPVTFFSFIILPAVFFFCMWYTWDAILYGAHIGYLLGILAITGIVLYAMYHFITTHIDLYNEELID